MPYDLTDKLVIGISSRALFDLEFENAIYDSQGVEEYAKYQRTHENEPLKEGTAFPLLKALLRLNTLIENRRFVEVVVMSKNSPDTGLRAFNAIEAHQLDISRAAFAGGRDVTSYLKAFKVDLFLSRDRAAVQEAIDRGVASAELQAPPEHAQFPENQIRIAFDGDAVLFSAESERIFKENGLDAFIKHEHENRHKSMAEGPFAKLLLSLSALQKQFPRDNCPVRIAIVTARNSPAHARVIHTLRAWNVNVDEAFFLGGMSKTEVLQAFGAHMFFDDQESHIRSASGFVPSGMVPYESGTMPISNPTESIQSEAYPAAESGQSQG